MKNLECDHEGNDNEIKVENGTRIWHKIQKTKQKKPIRTWDVTDINTNSVWVIVFGENVQPVQ